MSGKPSRQLGAILRNVPAATTASEAFREPEISALERPDPDRVTPPEQKTNQDPTPAPDIEVNAEVPLQVTVPKRVRRELLRMAADQDCSVRALILRSVRSLGIQIDETELRDKRRKA